MGKDVFLKNFSGFLSLIIGLLHFRRYRLYDDHITIPGFSEYGGMVRLSDLGQE